MQSEHIHGICADFFPKACHAMSSKQDPSLGMGSIDLHPYVQTVPLDTQRDKQKRGLLIYYVCLLVKGSYMDAIWARVLSIAFLCTSGVIFDFRRWRFAGERPLAILHADQRWESSDGWLNSLFIERGQAPAWLSMRGLSGRHLPWLCWSLRNALRRCCGDRQGSGDCQYDGIHPNSTSWISG